MDKPARQGEQDPERPKLDTWRKSGPDGPSDLDSERTSFQSMQLAYNEMKYIDIYDDRSTLNPRVGLAKHGIDYGSSQQRARTST